MSANGTVSIKGVGTATITISAGQTPEYFSASKSVTVVVERRDRGYLSFPDVRGDEWFATDRVLGYAVEHGLIMGYDDGRFAPYEPVTRAQAVTVLWRMAGPPAAPRPPLAAIAAQKRTRDEGRPEFSCGYAKSRTSVCVFAAGPRPAARGPLKDLRKEFQPPAPKMPLEEESGWGSLLPAPREKGEDRAEKGCEKDAGPSPVRSCGCRDACRPPDGARQKPGRLRG